MKFEKTTVNQHLLIAFVSYGLLIFEWTHFHSILDHPYMIFLIGVLSFLGSYNLTTAFMKKFYKK